MRRTEIMNRSGKKNKNVSFSKIGPILVFKLNLYFRGN